MKRQLVGMWREDPFSCILLLIFVVVSSLMFLDAFIVTDKERQRIEQAIEEKVVRDAEAEVVAATKGVNGIHYIKDSRTGNCFAFIEYYRHMGLATVDCDTLQNVTVIEE